MKIKFGCMILILLSLSSCYKYTEKNPLAVPPMFQEDYEELTNNNK